MNEILLYGTIGADAKHAEQFAQSLQAQDGKRVTVRINSGGGSVVHGLAMYNSLLRHKGGVTVQIDGFAGSMASVIAMAGRPVTMAQNGILMIHHPSGISEGTAKEMRQAAGVLDKLSGSLVDAYATKTRKPRAAIIKAMDDETFFTAKEAKAWGLVDEIGAELKAVASVVTGSFATDKYKAAAARRDAQIAVETSRNKCPVCGAVRPSLLKPCQGCGAEALHGLDLWRAATKREQLTK